jgi:hypothetical protein
MLAVLPSAIAMAQDGGFSKDDRISPQRLVLPGNNTRMSQPLMSQLGRRDSSCIPS